MRPRIVRVVVFAGLTLVFPCPWYMIAVGGLLPLPVILAFGPGGPVFLAFSLAHGLVYTWLFCRLARWVEAIARARRVHPSLASAILVAGFVALGFAPIYGGGENLLGANKLKHTAWATYRDELVPMVSGWR